MFLSRSTLFQVKTSYIWLVIVSATLVLADNLTQPIAIFRSRPDLQSPVLTPLNGLHDVSKMAPGYFFVSPYQQDQEGIYIFDNDANLVYSGFGSTGSSISHNPQTCMYKGEVHLCFYQGVQMLGWGHGHGIIMNKHYQVVKSIEPSGTEQASSDMHEFRLIDDGRRALMTQFRRSVYDLCDWNICDGLAYIQQGVFQEIDVETGEAVFVWHSLDHVDPSESYVGPATTEISGDGRYPTSPWDYFHINSIDKGTDGDYLISARHVSAIYKISGQNGDILWRLGGMKSDFKLDNFSFSFQHDARFISDNEKETVISLFDNGSNGFETTQPLSTGLIVTIDHRTKIARVTHEVQSPGNGHLSRSQGSYQILPNGNAVMGWGSDAFWSEHTSDGEVVFYGMIGTTNVMNYRIHKFDNWVGIPLTKPALWTYSFHGYQTSGNHNSYEGKQNNNVMFFYSSWNGHTQVTHWSYFCSSSKTKESFKKISKEERNGFETIYKSEHSYRYCYARAHDRNDYVLGTTDVIETFVPREEMKAYCDQLACRFVPDDETRAREKAEKEQQIQNATTASYATTTMSDTIATPDATTISEEETELEELVDDIDEALEKPRTRRILIHMALWAGLISVVIAVLIVARNLFKRHDRLKNETSILGRVLATDRRRKSSRSHRYQPVDNESDEEVHMGEVYDEANRLMLHRKTDGRISQENT